MAHHAEPMDIDSDFDNKENSLHHNNVLPFTEKGYEELDVSELNMKLRYSITPASSPMSKSYTANCLDNRNLDSGDDTLNGNFNENSNLTRSLNSTMTKCDNTVKSHKALPLQAISTEQFSDSNRNTSVLRPLDSTITQDNANITVTVCGPPDNDENLSLLSASSSAVHTPEATTPTKETLKNEGGSPIMRGLKSVLNMFRSSQSPIPPADSEDIVKPDILSPDDLPRSAEEAMSQAMLASTPIAAHRKKEANPTKRNSPNKEPIVFNEDLEKELQWKDETTIIFSQERIPIHKLFFQQPPTETKAASHDVELPPQAQDDMNSTVEYMDISYNDSIRDRTMTDVQVLANKTDCTIAGESDSEFVDCETTFTKNESVLEDKDKTPVVDQTQDLDLTKEIENAKENTSASRLKQIVLNTTQDILDATLSITPEDLMPEALLKSVPNQAAQTEIINNAIPSEIKIESTEVNETRLLDGTLDATLSSPENVPVLNQTIDITNTTIDVQQEDVNVTKTLESNNQPVSEPAVEITAINEELKCLNEQTKNTAIENIPIDMSEKPITETTPSNETIVLDDKVMEAPLDIEATNVKNISLTHDTTKDIDLDKTVANTTHIEQDQSIKIENEVPATLSSPITQEETVDKPSPVPIDEMISSPIKESSMTELAAEIPLPDEDDLEKELNIPVEVTTEIPTPPNNQQVEPETETIPSVIQQEPLLKEIVDDAAVLPQEPTNIDGENKIENEAPVLDTDILKPVPDIADVKNETLTLSEEILVSPSKVDIDEVDRIEEAVDVMNKTETITECLNQTVTCNIEDNTSQGNVSMDINESVIGFKPLPDIINQTNILPNVENSESVTNTSELVVADQPLVLTENSGKVAKEVLNPDIMLQSACKEIPELLSNAHISEEHKPTNEITNVVSEEVPAPSANEQINASPVTDVAKTCEDTPVVTDAQLNNVDVIPTEPVKQEDEVQPLKPDDMPVNETELKTVDDEIVISENNSPFVLVLAENISDIKTDSNSETEITTPGRVVVTPPPSPPIASKGYNFNFDEIDDPFATKTKIRMSPSLESPNKPVEPKASSRSIEKPVPKKEINNRRKSQPERKKPVAPKRKFNSTFSGAVDDKPAEIPIETFAGGDINLSSPPQVALDPSSVTIEEDKLVPEAEVVHEKSINLINEVQQVEKQIKPENKIEQPSASSSTDLLESDESTTVLTKDLKTNSSSEQSAYFSAGTSSSSESVPSRNVFNLPEIDDMNFNPFATKSKMRQSPTPSINMEDPFATKSKIRNSPDSSMFASKFESVESQVAPKISLHDDKIETELMEKDTSANLSNNTTTSSRATDEKNGTIKEINTEDEDTIEGPFLEAEDLNADDKMSDFDGENVDMMQFNELPPQGNDENLDNGELFIDAEAFEFLLNQNKSNTVVDSGKESLFLKFDPLFAKRMSSITSDGLVASLNKVQKRQSTPTKAAMPEPEVKSPIAGPSNLNVTQDMDVSEEFNDELNVTVSKPMMAVPPAVNTVTPRNKSLTPNRSNRRSFTFTSPAMAVIDRLLSLSGNSSLMHDTTVTQATREQNEADLALSQLRELLAEKEVHVYSLRSESQELKDRLTSLESHLKGLEDESRDRLKKINELNDRLAEKTKINKSMAAVVEEYERTIASLISETAQDKKRHAEERIKLINERDEQTAHLASMEVSFSDLHSKYEKSKQVILNCKANEDKYKKSIKDFEENLMKMQNNYELLKQHATSKLNHANQELEKMNKTHEAEVLKLNAMIKRKELHITSLEESLAQKTKANEELTAICDELINKVG
uniref:Transforming acidic coiled-coil-containing protein C-terminal domain-containing protein n=1 Tax=Heliothis virescens TaxID=7102 RepID=A0A2A4JUQ1_HELVI